jgi:hypothetical protein
MNKPKLDLLATIQLTEVVGNVGVRVAKTQKNPTDADIRLFADGSCYPSKELVEEFQLEYQGKESETPEFGFDVFETTKWGMWPASEHFVMIAQISKHAKKVDLFGKTSYDSDGHSRSSVIDQGAATFGKKLIAMLEQTYNEELFKNGNTSVDLLIVRDSPISQVPNGIYNIPKMMVKGKTAGTYSFERRENITIYPLVVSEASLTAETAKDAAVDEIASFAGDPTEGGEHANEPALHLGEDTGDAEAALKEANDILSAED